MQMAVVEFARHVAHIDTAQSEEFAPDGEHRVIHLMNEQESVTEKGGTMRLGAYDCRLIPESRAARLYGARSVSERHRHRYEFNNNYLETLTSAGLKIAGKSMDGSLVEVIELDDHPWFVACQFHPEFTSTPRDGHPLFSGFVVAARRQHEGQQG
jgi:CTP synthase